VNQGVFNLLESLLKKDLNTVVISGW
jgi:hypothetical protein